MKLQDIKDLSKDDILSALGLETKASTTSWMLSTLGIFGIGAVVGAGLALVLAPKSGEELRGDIGERVRNLRERNGERSDKRSEATLT